MPLLNLAGFTTPVHNKDIFILESDNIIGDNSYDIFSKYFKGATAFATDFASMMARVNKEYNPMNNLHDCAYWTKNILYTSIKKKQVAKVINDLGNEELRSTSSYDVGIRPALDTKGFGFPPTGAAASYSHIPDLNLTYGEYPQELDYSLTLEFRDGRVTTNSFQYTGKKYHIVSSYAHVEECDEFIYNGQKYIMFDKIPGKKTFESGGYYHFFPKEVFFKVQPIRWFINNGNSGNGIAVSEHILFNGVPYLSTKSGSDKYEDSMIASFLKTFQNDIIPSQVLENTDDQTVEPVKEEPIIPADRGINEFNFDIKKVSEEDIIRGAIESNIAVFLHGKSSDGKSARVKQVDPTCEIIYLRNASPDSLNGKSVYNSKTKEMIDIKPTWLKNVEEKCAKEPDKLHIIFFDEITNALPSIQGIAFNIILDKEVNGKWKLPDNARIVAAGNEMKDSLAANKLAEPLFNRFAHVYINTTTSAWIKWARENNIHPAIISYILYRKGEPLRKEYNGKTPNADPRKWEMASKVLYETKNPNMLRALVGKDITNEFITFCKSEVITLEDVLSGNYTDEKLNNLNTAQKHATIYNLSTVDEDNFKTVRDFTKLLGGEFRATFDSLWASDDEHRLEIVAELELEDEQTNTISEGQVLKRTKNEGV